MFSPNNLSARVCSQFLTRVKDWALVELKHGHDQKRLETLWTAIGSCTCLSDVFVCAHMCIPGQSLS